MILSYYMSCMSTSIYSTGTEVRALPDDLIPLLGLTVADDSHDGHFREMSVGCNF